MQSAKRICVGSRPPESKESGNAPFVAVEKSWVRRIVDVCLENHRGACLLRQQLFTFLTPRLANVCAAYVDDGFSDVNDVEQAAVRELTAIYLDDERLRLEMRKRVKEGPPAGSCHSFIVLKEIEKAAISETKSPAQLVPQFEEALLNEIQCVPDLMKPWLAVMKQPGALDPALVVQLCEYGMKSLEEWMPEGGYEQEIHSGMLKGFEKILEAARGPHARKSIAQAVGESMPQFRMANLAPIFEIYAPPPILERLPAISDVLECLAPGWRVPGCQSLMQFRNYSNGQVRDEIRIVAEGLVRSYDCSDDCADEVRVAAMHTQMKSLMKSQNGPVVKRGQWMELADALGCVRAGVAQETLAALSNAALLAPKRVEPKSADSPKV